MMKRWAALLLAILVVLPTLIACGGSKDTADTTTAATTEAPGAEATTAATEPAETEDIAVANVPADANYGGHTFTFLIGGNIENGREKNDFFAETMTGEALNDAIYNRNVAIEEKLGIKIETFEEYGSSNSGKGLSYQRLSKAYMANDTEYDAAMVSGYDVSTLAYTGYLFDMNEVPYIDVSQRWWDQKVNQDLTVGTRLYYTTGDISTADNDATCAILFSKDLVAQNNLENPYELVESGKWTLDKMLEMCSQVHADLNGDGKYDANDRIGAIVWDDTMMAWVNASGVKCCTLNEGGELTLTLNDERTMEFFDKLPAFYADEIAYSYQRVSYDITTPINMFANNQALFFAQLLDLVSYLRDMQTDFGLLPQPKATEEQQEYYNTIGSWHSVFLCIPGVQADVERTGVVIESLAAESYNVVTPAYYEQTLVGKYVRDEESVATLDIILATRVYDLGWFYGIGGYNEAVMNVWRKDANNFASMYKAVERVAQKSLDQINDAFAKLQ